MSELLKRWRPEQIKDVIGQDHIIPTIQAKVDKPSHMIFSGPSGVGKTSVANAYANQVTTDPIDYIFIPAAKDRGIDVIKSLTKTAMLMPRGNLRVIVLDEAHGLTPDAFEALLVTLEADIKTVFIFCTTQPWKLPNTIIGRCTAFKFLPVDIDLIVNHLNHICETEDLDPSDNKDIARIASGSMRNAIKHLEDNNLVDGLNGTIGHFQDAENLLDLILTFEHQEAMEMIKGFTGDWFHLFDCVNDHLNTILFQLTLADNVNDNLDTILTVCQYHEQLLASAKRGRYINDTTFIHWVAHLMVGADD